jgi:hypothetical protein
MVNELRFDDGAGSWRRRGLFGLEGEKETEESIEGGKSR